MSNMIQMRKNLLLELEKVNLQICFFVLAQGFMIQSLVPKFNPHIFQNMLVLAIWPKKYKCAKIDS